MTCIVGVVDNYDLSVYIGGDSAGIAGLSKTPMLAPKVFFNQDYLIGYTDSFRMGQILQYVFEPPQIEHRQEDIYAHMIKRFIPALRKCLLDEGFAKKDNNVEHGGSFMVGYRGRLFFIEQNFLVGESRYGYYAIGCGDDIALGALHLSKELIQRNPNARITKALAAAEAHSAGVMAPFTVLKLGTQRWKFS